METRREEDRGLLTIEEALAFVRTRGKRRLKRRRARRAAPALLAAVALISLGTVALASRHPAASPTPVRLPSTTIPIVLQIPDGTQDPPMALTAGQGDSVWYMDGQAEDPTLYRVSGEPPGERAYPLGSGCCGAGLQDFGGLTVAPDGTVWAVLNETLVELDPATGHTAFFALTRPTNVSGAPALDVLIGNGAHLVAAAPDGDELVVGFAYASGIDLFQLHQGRPSSHPTVIPLPSGYLALDVAFLADGTIGIGMEHLGSAPKPKIELVRPGGSRTEASVSDGFGVVPDGSGFLVGGYRPSYVSESGGVGPVSVRFELPSGQRWAVNGGSSGPDRLTLLSDGYIARGTYGGQIDVASAARSVLLGLPLQRYPNFPDEGGGGVPSRSTTTTSSVPRPAWILLRDRVQQIVTDGDGDLWVLTGTPSSSVAFAEMTSSELTAVLGH